MFYKTMRLEKSLFFILVILLIFPIVISEEITITPSPDEQETETPSLPTKENEKESEKLEIPDEPGQIIEEVGEAVKRGFLGIGANASHDNPIILIAENLERPTRLVFGIRDESEITIEKFIILICLFVMFLIIIYFPLKEIFDKKSLVIFSSLVLTLIISFTGTINRFASFYLSILDISIWMNTGIIVLINVLIYFLVVYLLIPLFKKFRQRSRVEEAEKKGLLFRLWAKIIERKKKSSLQSYSDDTVY